MLEPQLCVRCAAKDGVQRLLAVPRLKERIRLFGRRQRVAQPKAHARLPLLLLLLLLLLLPARPCCCSLCCCCLRAILWLRHMHHLGVEVVHNTDGTGGAVEGEPRHLHPTHARVRHCECLPLCGGGDDGAADAEAKRLARCSAHAELDIDQRRLQGERRGAGGRQAAIKELQEPRQGGGERVLLFLLQRKWRIIHSTVSDGIIERVCECVCVNVCECLNFFCLRLNFFCEPWVHSRMQTCTLTLEWRCTSSSSRVRNNAFVFSLPMVELGGE